MAMCHYFNLLFDFELDESGASTGGVVDGQSQGRKLSSSGSTTWTSELELNVLRLWPSNCLGAHGANRQNSQYEPM